MKQKVIFSGELIGSFVEVIEANNKNLVGMKGKVTDETYNMLELDNEKKLVKDQVILRVNMSGRNFILDGRLIAGRPEDRAKK